MVSRHSWIPICFALISFVSGLAWPDTISEFRRDEAYALYRAGRLDEALSVIEPAFNLQPHDSDLFYLKSLILLSHGRPVAEWLPLLEDAYRFAEWDLFTPEEAAFKLSAGYMKTLRYSEALVLMDTVIESVTNDSLYSSFYAEALARIGAISRADEFLESALSVHPDATSLHILRMKRSTTYRIAVAKRVHGNGLFADEPAILREIVLSYESVSDDVRSHCLMLLGSLVDDGIRLRIEQMSLAEEITEMAVKEVIGEMPRKRRDLDRLQAVLANSQWEAVLEEAVHSFSGSILDDLNSDGTFEHETEYREGDVISVTVDWNQDGMEDFYSRLSNDKPIYARFGADGNTHELFYDPYPYVSRVAQTGSTKTADYRIGKGALVYPIGTYTADGVLPMLLVRLPKPLADSDLKELTNTVTRTTITENGEQRTVEYLSRGKPHRAEIYQDGMLIRKTEYVDGNITASRTDSNRNGFFDLLERVEEGRIVEIHFDEDADGMPEYRHLPLVNTEEWDFNDDGLVDCREVYSDSSVTRQYSSKLDGVYDVTISVGNDFVRNGVSMKLYEDSFGNYWVGSRPREELLSSLLLPARNGELDILVFTFQGRRYIEVVR